MLAGTLVTSGFRLTASSSTRKWSNNLEELRVKVAESFPQNPGHLALIKIANETGFEEWLADATNNFDDDKRWIRQMPILGMKIGWGAAVHLHNAHVLQMARDALQELLDNALIERGDDDGLICYDRKSFIEKLKAILGPAPKSEGALSW